MSIERISLKGAEKRSTDMEDGVESYWDLATEVPVKAVIDNKLVAAAITSIDVTGYDCMVRTTDPIRTRRIPLHVLQALNPELGPPVSISRRNALVRLSVGALLGGLIATPIAAFRENQLSAALLEKEGDVSLLQRDASAKRIEEFEAGATGRYAKIISIGAAVGAAVAQAASTISQVLLTRGAKKNLASHLDEK